MCNDSIGTFSYSFDTDGSLAAFSVLFSTTSDDGESTGIGFMIIVSGEI